MRLHYPYVPLGLSDPLVLPLELLLIVQAFFGRRFLEPGAQGKGLDRVLAVPQWEILLMCNPFSNSDDGTGDF
jgi:hypothetical protein